MSTETYANSPMKCCQTCAYSRPDPYLSSPEWDHCARFQWSCKIAMGQFCGANLAHWRPKPPKRPRRSLRQWLYDILWA